MEIFPPNRLLRLAVGLCLPMAAALFLTLPSSRPVLAWSQGPPADRVGACGFGDTCRAGGCHNSFPVGSDTMQWELLQEAPDPGPLPPAYIPGQVYRLRLQLVDDDPLASIWGFELAPLIRCPLWEMGGEVEPVDDQRVQTTPGERGVVFLTHACPCQAVEDPACCGYVPPGASNENGWSFLWTAPRRGSGPVEFTFAINAANWDRQASGDRIELGEVTVPEEGCTPPVIRDLRVVKEDCDPASPDVREVRLVYAADPDDSIRQAISWSDLAQPRESWNAAADACLPLAEGRRLTYYSVGRLCDLGSEGH